jgi:hypothetical protein
VDLDQDPTFHPDADQDPSFQIKAQTLEKVLKKAHISYLFACHLQIDADPDPAYHFDADPDSDFYLTRIRGFLRMRIWMRIWVTKMMRILIRRSISNIFLL